MILASLAATLFVASGAMAAAPIDYSKTDQVEPYLETLRKKHEIPTKAWPPKDLPPSNEQGSGPHRPTPAEISKQPKDVQPYLESLREQGLIEPSRDAVTKPPVGSKDPGQVQPYLETVKKGVELEPKYRKTVDQAAGFAIVASNKFNLKSDKVEANTFEAIYTPSEKYSPSADLFYERQLYRNHYVGAIGLVAHLNVIWTKGKGIFTRSKAPATDTEFRFMAFPFSVGGSYRFTQLRFVQPFIQLAAAGLPYVETRNDDRPSRKGISRGYHVNGGAAFSLDWISRKDAWNRYDSQGIMHTYLVAQMEWFRTLSGAVDFSYDGTYVGLLFEF